MLVEAEVWPNLTALAQQRKIPLALVNARLSPRSERRFRQFRWFVRPYFQKLDLVCVPEESDIARWQSLGVDPAAIDRGSAVSSSIRTTSRCGRDSARGSAQLRNRPGPADPARWQHAPGEEEILAKIFWQLRREFPALFLVIAPRHVERTREIAAQLRALGMPSVRRSEVAAAPRPDCLLLDTTGELRDWYSVATIVFVGKSLTARGGQNPVEANSWPIARSFSVRTWRTSPPSRKRSSPRTARFKSTMSRPDAHLGNFLRDGSSRERLVPTPQGPRRASRRDGADRAIAGETRTRARGLKSLATGRALLILGAAS